MLRSAGILVGMAIDAKDGRIGKVTDLYFDDEDWTVRYLVVDAGSRVLLSPHSVRNPDMVHSILPVDLTRDQVRNAPTWDSEVPVSRRFERKHYDYYGYPYYWEGPYLWGGTANPYYVPGFPAPATMMAPEELEPGMPARGEDAGGKENPHLRSIRAVKGYHVEAKDGEIGHVEDFLLEDEDWRIRYLGVDTRNWLPGRHVAVPSEWARDIRWEDKAVAMEHYREEIRNAPEYIHGSPLTREWGEELEQYYHGAEFR